MKKLIILFLISVPIILKSQFEIDNLGLTNVYGIVDRRINSMEAVTIPSGSRVDFEGFMTLGDNTKVAVLTHESLTRKIQLNQLDRIVFRTNGTSIKELWQVQAFNGGVYADIVSNSLQMPLRNELDQEVKAFVEDLNSSNYFFEDYYLESYLHSVLNKIMPEPLGDNRPGVLNIRILKNSEPNAYIFPNGTIMLTTGLLSYLDSEEELLAVLSHEVAHFVLDHAVNNIKSAAQRQNRAEFWSAFITGVAAAAEIYMNVQHDYYTAGHFTSSVAVLSYSISSAIVDRLGLTYSREQELAADKAAASLLDFIGVGSEALSSTLEKLQNYYVERGLNQSDSKKSTHPSIDYRLMALGESKDFSNETYDRKISFVNTFNAELAFYERNFPLAYAIADRNVKANIATEEDYYIQSVVLTFMNNNESSNLKALELIQKARNLDVYPFNEISKHEAIVLLRLNRIAEAETSLRQYLSSIDSSLSKTDIESHYYQYLMQENEWTRKMIYKISR